MLLIILMNVTIIALIITKAIWIVTEEFKTKLMIQNEEKRYLLESTKNAISIIEGIENNDDPTKSSVHKNSIKEILSPIKEEIDKLEPYSVYNDYI